MTSAPAFACNTYSYTVSHAADRCVAHLADLGFSEFELMVYPGHLWPGDQAVCRGLVELVGSRGLRIVSLNMPNVDVNIAGASAEMRCYSLDLLERTVSLAGELGRAGW